MKPLLIGQAPGPNTEPDLPLYPMPKTSAGGKLLQLTGLTMSVYLAAFDRMNLLYDFPGRSGPRDDRFPRRSARVAARAVIQLLEQRKVIFVGRNVADAFGYTTAVAPFHDWGYCPKFSFSYVCVPHPSGRNHWYNQKMNRDESAEFWRVFIEQHPELFTVGREEQRYARERRMNKLRLVAAR